MHIKTKYVIGAVVVLICSMLYYFWYLGSATESYEDITDLSSEYNDGIYERCGKNRAGIDF